MASLFICAFFPSLLYFSCLITAQQPYTQRNCRPHDNTPSSLGYSCNGVNRSCQSFLIYRAQPTYNTVSSVASLFSVDSSQVSAINNNITKNMALATNTKVIVPITCSCSGRFYQANATHIVQPGDNYYMIANNTFEGLTTCKAIRSQKTDPNVVNIFPGEKLTIPLRCACPTRRQLKKDIRYLMSYVIQSGDTIWTIANKFGADFVQTLEANEKSEQDSVINPFTTLIVPLHNPPDGSVMEYPPYVPPPPSAPSSPPPTATPPPPPQPSSENSVKKWVIFVSGVVAGGALVSVLGVIIFYMRKKSSQGIEMHEKTLVKKLLETDSNTQEYLEYISRIASVKIYSFKDLQAATANFSSDHLIKGSVYKGNINGDEVAIKKIDRDISEEVNAVNKINHDNLIRLLGVSFDHGIWYSVYEYAGNGLLSEWIYQDSLDGKTLSWGKRMQVACDVAKGLNHLHSFTSPPHVHINISSRNILLDDKFRAKIAKVGLSRPISGNNGYFTLTKHIVGNAGYLAPEYLENGVVSPMLDVYAFGVLLLEILTGKDVARLYEGVWVKAHLSDILAEVLSKEQGTSKVKEFMDSSLGEDYPTDQAYNLLVLVEHCLRKDPENRPYMDEIVQILSKTVATSVTCGSTSSASTSSS